MANFKDCPKFKVHDDYYTHKKSWEQIAHLIPKDKVIWEACSLNSNGQSIRYLQELGFDVVGGRDIDIFKHNMGDIIITNPPFSTKLKIKILQYIRSLNKPFIIIMNSCNVFSKYFNEIFGDLDIKFIIPHKKLHYDKYENGEHIESKKNTSFYSIYITWGILDKNEFI